MATEWISPTWRMPEESNQSKFENYSLSFDGANEFIQVDNDLFGGLEKFSVSFWYNISTVSGDRAVVGRWSLADPQMLIYHQGSTGYWRIIFVNNSGTSQGITTTFAATLNTWQFISFIYDGSTVSVQLNNETVQSQSSSGSVRVQSAAPGFQIGAENSAKDFSGQIDQLCVFDYALSTDQRNYLYNSGTPQNPMAISGNAPIAYYPLGGSSTGSASTLTIPNESVLSATVFNFDGATDTINVSDSSLLKPSTITVSMWIKGGAQNTYTYCLAKYYTGGGAAYGFYTGATTNKIAFTLRKGDDSGWVTTGFSTVMDDNWHNVIGTFDGANVKLYVDGTITSTVSSGTTGITYGSGDLTIGAFLNTGILDFNGEISNVQVWNAELESSDVTTLYNNGVPLLTGTQPQAANLKAWYKMNVDTSTWNGSDWVVGEAQANYSSALSTNIGATTLTDYIDLTSGFTTGGASDNSISFWFKTTQGGGDNAILGAGSSRYITVHWGYLYSNSSSSDGFRMYSGSTINDGAWHHAVYTYNQTSGAWKLYIDGDLSNSVTAATGQPVFPISRFGGYYNTTYYYDGSISNVAYYNVELDSAKVSTLYNNGTPEQSISYSPISWWKLNNLTTGIQDSVGSNNGTNTGVTVTDIQVSTLNGLSSGMTTANLVNSDLTRSIPYSSYSMEFDGAADYVSCGSVDETEGITTMSISGWINPQASGVGGAAGIIAKETRDWYIGWYSVPANSIRFLISDDNGATKDALNSLTLGTNADVLNKWHHFVCTWDASDKLKIYINGVLSSETNSVNANSALPTSTNNVEIGRRVATYFDGNLSNIAIWTSVLTEDQVLTIYNGGVPNSLSSLSPVSWWSLAGDSYYNGSDWICPDLGSGSNNGTSSGMGGTELVGNGPGSTANGTATSMDIPANLKGNAPNSSKNAFSINMNSADRVADVPA